MKFCSKWVELNSNPEWSNRDPRRETFYIFFFCGFWLLSIRYLWYKSNNNKGYEDRKGVGRMGSFEEGEIEYSV